MVTEGGDSCEHSITYRVVELLCCMLETNATLCVNYTNKKKIYQKKGTIFFCASRNQSSLLEDDIAPVENA